MIDRAIYFLHRECFDHRFDAMSGRETQHLGGVGRTPRTPSANGFLGKQWEDRQSQIGVRDAHEH